MSTVNNLYKPHLFLAKTQSKDHFIASVCIPILEGTRLKKIKHEVYDKDKHDPEFKDCDIVTFYLEKTKDKYSGNLTTVQVTGRTYLDRVVTIKKDEDCDKVAIVVKLKSNSQNGHKKTAIHLYDKAAEPLGGE